MEGLKENNGRIYLNKYSLKKLRKERCWSQDKLADICFENRLCVSLSSIKRAEAGRRVLYRTALGLSAALNVSVNDLIK